jgi:UTP--glucose-1-phosphate uridylyltransferase
MTPMNIRKAVITAAGRGLRLAPAADTVQKAMLPFIDRDGLNKPAIQIIAEEAMEAGIEQICVVCAPGDEERYIERFSQLRENLKTAYEGVEWASNQIQRLDTLFNCVSFAPQEEANGYGHAVYCAKDFVQNEPFLLLLGDHLYISSDKTKNCASQLLELAKKEEAAVSAVHSTREHLVTRYGTVGGKRLPDSKGIYQIEKVLEKPSVSLAELELQVPGLRAGHYLCFFGMHVLTPAVFELLEEDLEKDKAKGEKGTMLTPSLQRLARKEKYLALEVEGIRYDIGSKFGMLRTQLALALAGEDSEEAMQIIVETMAESQRPGKGEA